MTKIKTPLHATTNYRALMEREVYDMGCDDPWGDHIYSIKIEGVSFCFSLNHATKTCRPISYGEVICVKTAIVYNWDKIIMADRFLHKHLYEYENRDLMGIHEYYKCLKKKTNRPWSR